MKKLKTTSVKRPQLSKPIRGERIDLYLLAYARARNKNHAHSLVLDQVEKSDLSRADIAKMLGKDPAQITRWLGSAGNLTLDTLSDLLLATGGSFMDLKVIDPFEGAKSNYQEISRYASLSTPSSYTTVMPRNEVNALKKPTFTVSHPHIKENTYVEVH